MIHLALTLIALVVIITFVSGTLSVVGAAWEVHPGWGIVAFLGMAAFWLVLLIFML